MKKIAIIICLAGFFSCAAQSLAQDPAGVQEEVLDNTTIITEENAIQPLPDAPTEVPRQMRISERFGRSMSNILFSPLELPAQIYLRARHQQDKTNNHFAIAGGLIEGIPMGAFVYFPWRLGAGLVDLFTIWTPKCDKALIEPEYLSFSPKILDDSPLTLDKNPKPAGK